MTSNLTRASLQGQNLNRLSDFIGHALSRGVVFLAVLLCLLCVSGAAHAQTLIGVQDFETTPATPTLGVVRTGGAILTGNNPSPGLPTTSYAVEGSTGQAFTVTNGTGNVVFNNVATSTYTGVQITFRIASFSLTSGNGADVADTVTAAISTDNGTTYFNTAQVTGNSNARYDYSATGSLAATFNGTNTPTIATSGTGTAGVSTVTITIPNGTPQVKLRITALNDNAGERWAIDNVRITGNPITSTTPTITGLSPSSGVVGTPVTITGTNFNGLTSVTFSNGVAATPTANTSTQIMTTVPVGAVTGPITVTTNNGSATSGTFTVTTPPSTTLVISEVYGGGGNTSATYLNDFVEIYNLGSTTINLSGYSLQYASPTGSFSTTNSTPLSGNIAPGAYYLVQEASGSTAGNPIGATLPPANLTGTVNLGAAAGKLALVNGTAPISGPSDTSVVDFVGYGSTANQSETAPAPGPSPSNTMSVTRTLVTTDTNNNSVDFANAVPSPLSTTDSTPPTVTSIVRAGNNPASGASVAFTVTFSEAVTGVDASDFAPTTTGSLAGATISSVTGSGTTYTVTVGGYFGSGTLRLDLIDNDSIVDASGNPLGGTGAGNGNFTSGPIYDIVVAALISEFRLSGPQGSTDEFIEINNTTNAALDLTGWTLSDGTNTFTLASTIGAHAYYLVAGTGYSLGYYASADQTLPAGTDIALNSTLTLRNASGTVADTVGNLSGTSGLVQTDQYSFMRRLEAGIPRDSNDDLADFNLVDTSSTSNGGADGTGTGRLVTARLGAPGPQNSASPIQRNAGISIAPLNIPGSGVASDTRYPSRNSAIDPRGRLTLRRTITNNTGAAVSKMRFRITTITGGTSTNAGQADLRAIRSAGVRYYASDGTTILQATVPMPLDLPSLPTEAPLAATSSGNGGGLNSSWTVALPGGTLASGGTVGVEFLFGIVTDGNYRVVVDTELLP